MDFADDLPKNTDDHLNICENNIIIIMNFSFMD